MRIQTPTPIEDAAPRKFTPLPEGSYNVSIADLKKGTSQAGNTKLDITLEITNGDFMHRRRDLFDLNWRRRCTLLRLATGQQAA